MPDPRPTNDLLISHNGSDILFSGDGDDFLYDGSGADFLEGGAGDDTIVLSNDSNEDLVVVGYGDDRIVGGDASDRIVLRLANIVLPEGAAGLGSDVASTGIPLLGGFIFARGDLPGSLAASYVGALQSTFDVELDPQVELALPTTRVQDIAPSPWSAISSYTSEDLIVTWQDPSNNKTYHVSQSQSPIDVSYYLDGDQLR